MGLRYRDGDGKRRPVPFVGIRMSACCDCGLVHKHTFHVENGKIMETVERAERETSNIRRGMVKNETIVAVRDSNVYVIPRRIVQRRKAKKFTVTIGPC